MPIPSATLTIADGQLGISPAASGNVSVVMGVCSKGTPSTVYGAYRNIPTMVAALGYGPAVEAAAIQIVNKGTVYVMPLTPAYDGVASAVTKVGTGAGTMTVAFGPAETITIVCTTGGNNGTAAFTYKIGSGATSSPVTSVAGATWVWSIPGTLTKLTLTQGTGFDATDAWTISPTAVVSQTVNPGPGNGSLAHTTSQPFDDYTAQVEIRSTGVGGTGTFRYTMDNFASDSGADLSTWSSDILIPATPFKYAIPNTGVYVIFSSDSFTDGDTHSFTTIASNYSGATVTAAFATLAGLTSLSYGFGHLVGMTASAANAATSAGLVDTALATAESAYRYIHWHMDVPTVGTRILSGGLPIADTADTDSVVAAAFAGSEHERVVWGAGDYLGTSAVRGWLCRRPASWQGAGRTAKATISENLHRVLAGAVKGIVKLYRDESATEALDVARFVTLRSYVGKPGYYITKGRTGASNTSDFSRLANRRVMDRACEIVYAKGVDLIGSTVAVNEDGTITEKAAQRIESAINNALVAALVSLGHASPVDDGMVAVSRTHNVLSTSLLPVTIRILPLASLDYLTFDMGFKAPTSLS